METERNDCYPICSCKPETEWKWERGKYCEKCFELKKKGSNFNMKRLPVTTKTQESTIHGPTVDIIVRNTVQEVKVPPPPFKCQYLIEREGESKESHHDVSVYHRQKHLGDISLKKKNITIVKSDVKKLFRDKAMKKKNQLIGDLWPHWYQELSDKQMCLLENLENALKADWEQDIGKVTQQLLYQYGIHPRINEKIIEAAAEKSFLEPFLFMLYIFKMLGFSFQPASNTLRHIYSVNERLILSAVSYFSMPFLISDLNVLLPKIKLPKFKTEYVERNWKYKKYSSPYLVPQPYTREKPIFKQIVQIDAAELEEDEDDWFNKYVLKHKSQLSGRGMQKKSSFKTSKEAKKKKLHFRNISTDKISETEKKKVTEEAVAPLSVEQPSITKESSEEIFPLKEETYKPEPMFITSEVFLGKLQNLSQNFLQKSDLRFQIPRSTSNSKLKGVSAASGIPADNCVSLVNGVNGVPGINGVSITLKNNKELSDPIVSVSKCKNLNENSIASNRITSKIELDLPQTKTLSITWAQSVEGSNTILGDLVDKKLPSSLIEVSYENLRIEIQRFEDYNEIVRLVKDIIDEVVENSLKEIEEREEAREIKLGEEWEEAREDEITSNVLLEELQHKCEYEVQYPVFKKEPRSFRKRVLRDMAESTCDTFDFPKLPNSRSPYVLKPSSSTLLPSPLDTVCILSKYIEGYWDKLGRRSFSFSLTQSYDRQMNPLQEALAAIASLGNPLAAFPNIERHPAIQKWERNRNNFVLKPETKAELWETSKAEVDSLLFVKSRLKFSEIGDVPENEKKFMNWNKHDWLKSRSDKLMAKGLSMIKKQFVTQTRDYWKALKPDFFASEERIRKTFFTYLPSKETDVMSKIYVKR